MFIKKTHSYLKSYEDVENVTKQAFELIAVEIVNQLILQEITSAPNVISCNDTIARKLDKILAMHYREVMTEIVAAIELHSNLELS